MAQLTTLAHAFLAARAARFAWLDKLCAVAPAHDGDYEPLRLIREALACYLDGYIMAANLTTAAHVEHTLVEELRRRGFVPVKASPILHGAIASASANKLFADPEVLEKIDHLRQVRNPLTHRKVDGHKHSVMRRSRAPKRAPELILEDDAPLGLEVTHGLFFASLRPFKAPTVPDVAASSEGQS
ncbi:hypothetical protein RCH10_004719 [Variovorax sp. GrIS 2.14]|uniref:hypothetical protein n=1 Tax=Variovorax sp. GrIS 2.14 TaxID=3071709 RepID=UPI0038F5E37D